MVIARRKAGVKIARVETITKTSRLKAVMAPCEGGRRLGTVVQNVSEDANPAPGRREETGMYEEARLGQLPARKAEESVGHGVRFKIGTLNVKSIRKHTMHLQIEKYMDEASVSVLCLQETMVAQTTQYVVGDLLYVMCGSGVEGEREYAGVGMVFRKDARKYITGFEISKDGRTLAVGLDCAPRRLTLITVYVPQSRREE